MSVPQSPVHTSDTSERYLLTQLQIQNAVLETKLAHAQKEKEAAINSSVLIARNLSSFLTSNRPAHSSNTKCNCAVSDHEPPSQTLEFYKKRVQDLEMKLMDKEMALRESSLIGDEYTSNRPHGDASFSTISTETLPAQDKSTMLTPKISSGDVDMINLEAILDQVEDIVDKPQDESSTTEHNHKDALENTSDTQHVNSQNQAQVVERAKTKQIFTTAPSVLSVGLDVSKSMTTSRYDSQSTTGQEEILSAKQRWEIYTRPQAPRQLRNGEFVDPDFDVDNILYDPPEIDEYPKRAVLIHNLPRNITVGEILARVRGGLVLEAYLAPTTNIIGSMSAIVRFLHGISAERYVDFCACYPQTFGGLVAKVDLIPTPSHSCPFHRHRGVTHFLQTRVLEVKNFPSGLKIRDMECDIAACGPIGAPQKYYKMECVGEGEQRRLRISCNSVERAVELMRDLRSTMEMTGLGLTFGEDPCKGLVEELIYPSQTVTELASQDSDVIVDVNSNDSHVNSRTSSTFNNTHNIHTHEPDFSIIVQNKPSYKSKGLSWADEVNEAVENGILVPDFSSQTHKNMSSATKSEVTRRKMPAGIAASRYSTDVPMLGQSGQSQYATNRPRRRSKLYKSFSAEDLSSEDEGMTKTDEVKDGDNATSITIDILSDTDAGESDGRRSDDKVMIMPLTPTSMHLPPSLPVSPVSPISLLDDSTADQSFLGSEATFTIQDEEDKENSPPTRPVDVATVAMENTSLTE